jgi:hypothetical protein
MGFNVLLQGVSPTDSMANSALVAGLVPDELFISVSIAYTLA